MDIDISPDEYQRIRRHDTIMTERVLDLERQIDLLRRDAPRWIATTERMPDDEQTVLIVTSDGEVWTGYHDDDTWLYVSCDPVGLEVTHWMDFPAPPGND